MEDYSDFYFEKYKKERVGDDAHHHFSIEDARVNKNIKKRKNAVKHKYLLVICLFCISIALFLLSVEYFSPVGIVNEIKNLSSRNESMLTFYAVSFGSFDNLEAARNSASAIRNAGGGGYIYFDGIYNVLAAAYKNKKDAESIVGINTAKMIEIKVAIPKEQDFSQKVRKIAKKTFTFKESLFDKLYELSAKLDLGRVSKEETLATLKILRDDYQSLIKDYTDSYKQDNGEFALNYCIKLNTALELLNNLLNENLERPSLLADIRYSYLLIINL